MALTALVSLSLAAPWGFGGTPAVLARALCVASLALAWLALVRGRLGRELWLPGVPAWPALGLLVLAGLQLVPVPAPVLAVLAPGSQAIWRPELPAAGAVLGAGPFPISVRPGATWEWLAWVGALVSLAWLASAGWRGLRRPELLAAVLLGGVSLVAVYGLFARRLAGELIYGQFAVQTIAPLGSFVSKNHFAGYVALGVPLGLGLAAGLAARSRDGGWRGDWTNGPAVVGVVAALLGALVPGFATLVSLSRGGVLSATLGAAFFGVAWWWRARSLARSGRGAPLAAGALALLLVGLLFGSLPEEARERVGSLAARDSSRDFRLRTWAVALEAAGDSPFVGQGLGAFHDAFPRWKRRDGELRVEHAENDYLELLVEGGGVGVLLGLLAVGLSFVRTLTGLVRLPEGLRAGIGLGALGGVVGIAAHSLLDFNLRIPSNALLAATLAAIAVGSSGVPARRVTGLAAGAWSLALAGGLGLVLLRPVDPWPAAQASAVRAGEGGEPPSALRLELAEQRLREAVASRPALAEAWLLLAWVRAARGEPDAAELASWAVRLEPAREALRREAAQLGAVP